MPLLPLIWIISILFGGLPILLASRKFRKLIKNLFSDPKKNKLGILGMPMSGKTLFLSHLRKVPYVQKGTGYNEKYDSFIFKTSSGKEIHIDSGFDIAGNDDVRSEYTSIMDNSDVIFYFFDISLYFTDINYRRNCNSRLLYLHNYFEKNKEKELVLFASHIDKCEMDRSKIITNFRKQIKDKSYKDLLGNTNFINLTDIKELTEIIDLIFEKK